MKAGNKMSCNNISYLDIPQRINTNQKILNEIMQLPDKLRKEIRLMAKQYEILEINQEPPIMHDRFILIENPYIVKYCAFGTELPVFEWVIKIEDLK